MVTATSILSPARSAVSACASEVKAVPSGPTVGPNRHWGKEGPGEFSHANPGENSFRE